MKLVRYWDPAAATARWGVHEGDRVREIIGNPYNGVKTSNNTHNLAAVKLLPPCEPTKIIAGGANYYGHLKEVGLAVPDVPVVAKPMHNTPPDQVLKNLLGYTCVNDVTARDIQVIGGNLLHLCHSKSFDTFCPTGPWVETELDAHNLDIELRINGQVRQKKTNTSDMIFPVENMVSYFSHVMTLLPGDLILTGAPPGIGGMEPGDQVEVIIQGIGTLRHTVVRAT